MKRLAAAFLMLVAGSVGMAQTARDFIRVLEDDQAPIVDRACDPNKDRVVRGQPPANCIITRGAGSIRDIPAPQHSPDDAALVAACSTALGIARMAGMQAVTSPEMTGGLDTDLD